MNDDPAERKRRIRRAALLFGSIALAFYLAFIVMSVLRAAT
jgi:hypothetical protein